MVDGMIYDYHEDRLLLDGSNEGINPLAPCFTILSFIHFNLRVDSNTMRTMDEILDPQIPGQYHQTSVRREASPCCSGGSKFGTSP
jgi:hypothetical protein